MVNLYGGTGFIGTRFQSMFPCVVNKRDELVPKSNDILYLISTTDNYNIFTDPHIDIDTNLSLLIDVLEHCKGKEIVFNFASSWFVYGQIDSVDPIPETSHCHPQGFYSITKYAAEQLLISYCNTFNIKYRILRYANVVGPGDMKVSEKRNVLSFLINKIKNNEPIQLVNNGLFTRDYIHVTDVCRATQLIMDKGELNNIYNVGNEEPISFKDAIEYVIMKTKSKSVVTSVGASETKSRVPNSCTINCSKLRNLGFRPIYNVYDILDDLIN